MHKGGARLTSSERRSTQDREPRTNYQLSFIAVIALCTTIQLADFKPKAAEPNQHQFRSTLDRILDKIFQQSLEQ